jgi:hypothetical protein
MPAGSFFVSNPPFHGRPADLHPLIINLSGQAPFWALLPGDWLFNRSSAALMPRLRKVVAIGRIQWFENSPYSSKENYAWMLFAHPSDEPTTFVGREAGAVVNLFTRELVP